MNDPANKRSHSHLKLMRIEKEKCSQLVHAGHFLSDMNRPGDELF